MIIIRMIKAGFRSMWEYSQGSGICELFSKIVIRKKCKIISKVTINIFK